jgi:hypothetical protein
MASHENARVPTDLRRGEANAAVVAHGFQHENDPLLDLAGDAADERSGLAEPRVRVLDERDGH